MAAAMKLVLLVGIARHATATLQLAGHRTLASQSPKEFSLAAASKPSGVFYGDSRCPCIGFDNIEGETALQIEGKGEEKVEVAYPADLGARCEAWDDNRHLECKRGAKPGSGKGWCAQSWCYVDPCKCDIDVLPKRAASYMQEATFRGKPLFWSYATCGGSDMFTKKVPKVGLPKCRCIGFAGVAGTTEITFKDGKMGEYPADMGTSCTAWDLNIHPECKGGKAPSWCKANWCYVDPCDCELPGDTDPRNTVPKISAYLPKATFTGKSLYFSYETCGSPDTWTEENHPDACVNQGTEDACGKLSRCSWAGSRCLGWELVHHPLCQDAAKKILTEKERSGSATHTLSLAGMATMMAAALVAAHT